MSFGGPAKVTKSVGVARVTPTGLVAELSELIVPPRGSAPLAAISPLPVPGTFQPGGPIGMAGQGVCTGGTGAQKLRTPPVVKVNTPVHVAVPLIGLAMAGRAIAVNAAHTKPRSFLRLITYFPPHSYPIPQQ